MSLTEAELEIGNQGLSLIGQKAVDYSDSSTAETGTAGVNYNRLDLVFAQTRNALQRSFEWNFTSARMALVSSWLTATAYTTDMYVWVSSVLYKCNEAHVSGSWNTDYVLDDSDHVVDGSDYVRDDIIDFKWDMITDRPETYWSYRYALPSDFLRFNYRWLKKNETRLAIEGSNIVTNETSLNINYIKKVTDTTLFDDLFTEVFIYDLAIKLTFSVLGAGYAVQALRKELLVQRQRKMLKARQVCFAEDNDTGEMTSWAETRYGSGKV